MATGKKEEDGGGLGTGPNAKWEKFFEKFAEIKTLPADGWKPVHLIAYFCQKYYDAYKINYQFKFNSPSPPKSFEVFQIKKLAMLLSSDPVILREYIDWVYKVKVEGGKRRLTSISFMTVEPLVNDYKCNVLLGKKKQLQVDRSTPLPAQFREIILKESGLVINSYGDLAFVYQASKAESLDAATAAKLALALTKLQEAGFDLTALERVV